MNPIGDYVTTSPTGTPAPIVGKAQNRTPECANPVEGVEGGDDNTRAPSPIPDAAPDHIELSGSSSSIHSVAETEVIGSPSVTGNQFSLVIYLLMKLLRFA